MSSATGSSNLADYGGNSTIYDYPPRPFHQDRASQRHHYHHQQQQQQHLPRSIPIMALIHLLCLGLCTLSNLADAGDQDRANKACFHLPESLDRACVCTPIAGGAAASGGGGISLFCKGLNDTKAFDLESKDKEDERRRGGNDILGGSEFPEEYRKLLWEQVMTIEVKDSAIQAVKMADFAHYRHLTKLSVTDSKVSKFLIQSGVGSHRAEASRALRGDRMNLDGMASTSAADLTLLRLQTLDLSSNELTELDVASLGELTHLKEINVSRNSLRQLSPVFGALGQLEVLDLSSNRLDETLNPKVLQELPKSIKYLDISSKIKQHGIHTYICTRSLHARTYSHVPSRQSILLSSIRS